VQVFLDKVYERDKVSFFPCQRGAISPISPPKVTTFSSAPFFWPFVWTKRQQRMPPWDPQPDDRNEAGQTPLVEAMVQV